MKLIKNYLYNVSYQIFVLIIPLITVPYVSRVLGSEGVGINAYTNSIISYFVLFGSIGINLYGNRTIAYVRDSYEKLSQTFWEIAFLRFVVIFISYIVFLISLSFIRQYQIFYFYQSFLILAAGVDISWFFMGIEDFKKTIARNMLVKLTSLVAIFILVKDQSDIGIYILILSISTLLGNLTLWPYLKKIVTKPNWKSLNLKSHIVPSLALFIPQIATQIYLVLNKTMLGYMTNVQNAGFYENSDKLVKIVLAVVTASGTVMLPRMANTFSSGNLKLVNEYVRRSFDFVNAIGFPTTFGLAAIAPSFSVWFFGKDFAITGTLIPILSIVIILIGWSNVLGTQYLLPTNQTKYFTISVTTGAVVNLVLNLALINIYGIYGAIWATVISEFVVTMVQIILIRNQFSIYKLFQGTWKYLCASVVMFIFVRLANMKMPGTFGSFVIQIFIGLFIYVILIIVLHAPILEQLMDLKNKVSKRK